MGIKYEFTNCNYFIDLNTFYLLKLLVDYNMILNIQREAAD